MARGSLLFGSQTQHFVHFALFVWKKHVLNEWNHINFGPWIFSNFFGPSWHLTPALKHAIWHQNLWSVDCNAAHFFRHSFAEILRKSFFSNFQYLPIPSFSSSCSRSLSHSHTLFFTHSLSYVAWLWNCLVPVIEFPAMKVLSVCYWIPGNEIA